ncbi:MAG: SPOR domain-containing protein [Nitrospirota bacterium]|jgi:cell division septation protein DedD|nr:SPOR domain-containing protein [Nitrospirota bacterium]
MKRTEIKEMSSVFYIGKWIVIIAILITSSLSFTLGYFVGKSFQPPVVNQTTVIPVQESAEQKNIESEKKEALVRQPEQTQKPQETQQTVKAQQAQETKKTQITKETKQTTETKETKKTLKTRKYTVQTGAFKDISDANALKSRLDKKGYKTYIAPTETKTHKKLYKVMVGDFVTRKEAEVLSIKIKKAEGLKTFVTFKTDQEDLR